MSENTFWAKAGGVEREFTVGEEDAADAWMIRMNAAVSADQGGGGPTQEFLTEEQLKGCLSSLYGVTAVSIYNFLLLTIALVITFIFGADTDLLVPAILIVISTLIEGYRGSRIPNWSRDELNLNWFSLGLNVMGLLIIFAFMTFPALTAGGLMMVWIVRFVTGANMLADIVQMIAQADTNRTNRNSKED